MASVALLVALVDGTDWVVRVGCWVVRVGCWVAVLTELLLLLLADGLLRSRGYAPPLA